MRSYQYLLIRVLVFVCLKNAVDSNKIGFFVCNIAIIAPKCQHDCGPSLPPFITTFILGGSEIIRATSRADIAVPADRPSSKQIIQYEAGGLGQR